MGISKEKMQTIIENCFNAECNIATIHDAFERGFRVGMQKGISAQPEVIRCKDCEHWDTTWQNDFAPNYHYCPLVDGTRRGDFYCADADMRGEQE